MTVGRDEIEPAVEVVVEKQHAERQRAPARGPDAGDDRLVGKLQRRLLRDVQRRHLVGEVADRDAQRAVVAEIGRVDAHRAAAVAVRVERDARAGPDLHEPAVALVVEHEVLHRVIRDDEVGPAVGVEIDGGDAERLRHRHTSSRIPDLHPRARGDVGEVSVAIVPVQIGKRALERARRTVGAADAHEPEILLQIDVPGPAHVVADEEIEIAVAVVVEPGGARAPLIRAPLHTGRTRHVDEAPADVSEETIGADGGHEEIDPAVVVVVGGGDAHSVEVHRQAGGPGHVREVPAAVVAIQHEA